MRSNAGAAQKQGTSELKFRRPSSTSLWVLQQERDQQKDDAKGSSFMESMSAHADLSTPAGTGGTRLIARVREEEGSFKAELTIFLKKEGFKEDKEMRIRGPKRKDKRYAALDVLLLKKAANAAAPKTSSYSDGSREYMGARARQRELLGKDWTEADCVKMEKEEKLKLDIFYKDVEDLSSTAAPVVEIKVEKVFKPVGPDWAKPGPITTTPWKGNWLVHERQEMSTGKHYPAIWFDTKTGVYYIRSSTTRTGFVTTTPPNKPDIHPVIFKGGSASVMSTAAPTRKDDFQVILQDLPKTGRLLKSPLVFLDMPAAFCGLFDGLRSSGAAAEFCARNFHKHLLPRLSARHTAWEDFELCDVLKETVEALDQALLASQCLFEGCSVAVMLQIGKLVAAASVGGTRVVMKRRGKPAKVVVEPHVPSDPDEARRVEQYGGNIADGEVGSNFRAVGEDEKEEELLRIRYGAHCFAVMGMSPEDVKGVKDIKEIRKIYRRKSLQIHPDKVPEHLKELASIAFGKLDAACEAVEYMLGTNNEATRTLVGLLHRFDQTNGIMNQQEATGILGVSNAAAGESVVNSSTRTIHKLLSTSVQDEVRRDVERGEQILKEAVEGLKRTWEVPPPSRRRIGCTRGLGLRDLKKPGPAVRCLPDFAEVVEIKPGDDFCIGMLSDGVSLTLEEVGVAMEKQWGRPKATSLEICRQTRGKGGQQPSVSATCMYYEHSEPEAEVKPPKRVKTDGTQVKVKHILLRHKDIKVHDPDIRPGKLASKRNLAEAESTLLDVIEELMKQDCSNFPQVCRRISECTTADNPITTAGDIGWLTKGAGPADDPILSAAFSLKVGAVSDITPSPRGLHILLRVG
mmetsp:Transcript_49177/g.111539  ORF Transcript_49177/g.111539 Transcript_49177/m.111539 type:complete len:857 (+) Transcript_49177:28-2598(+)